jgi:hypothetical protein
MATLAVYSEMNYTVKQHVTTYLLPVIVETQIKGRKQEKRTLDMSQWSASPEHPAVRELGIAAAVAKPIAIDGLRAKVHASTAKDAPYVVYNNLEARNSKIAAKVKSTTGIEKAEWIATWIAVNPNADAGNIKFANDEFFAILKVASGGSMLAKQGAACAAAGAKK